MSIKHELQRIIYGTGAIGKKDIIKKITNHLRTGKKTGVANEGKKYTKQQEEEKLIQFIDEYNFWHTQAISENNKIGEGSEQKVFYDYNKGTVLKTNDSIFFEYWEDYLNNLLIHNYLFPDTAYTLLGFKKIDAILYAVVEQQHIIRTKDIDLENVKTFLLRNGFENTRRNDYYNKDLGIILEDLHDENVINSNEVLFFIDTVFYITDEFNKDAHE